MKAFKFLIVLVTLVSTFAVSEAQIRVSVGRGRYYHGGRYWHHRAPYMHRHHRMYRYY